MSDVDKNRLGAVDYALALYCAASLLHFAHNAQFLASYPNMPEWLSSTHVYASWVGVTAIGVTGYLLLRNSRRLIGYGLIILYGALGFGGLDHYTLAPFSAHSASMNLTILLEVAAASILIAVTTFDVFRARRHP